MPQKLSVAKCPECIARWLRGAIVNDLEDLGTRCGLRLTQAHRLTGDIEPADDLRFVVNDVFDTVYTFAEDAGYSLCDEHGARHR